MAGGPPAWLGSPSLSLTRWPRFSDWCRENAVPGRGRRRGNNCTRQEPTPPIHQRRWTERPPGGRAYLFHAWAISDSHAVEESGPLIARYTPVNFLAVGAVIEAVKKLSLFNVQLLFVIDGGASRNLFFKDAAPKAHPKMTNDN